MLGQLFGPLGQSIPSQRFQDPNDARMQRAPPLLEQTAVGHLVRQSVREGVCWLREEARLVQELRSLELGEMAAQVGVRQVGNGSQQGKRHFCTNDGGGLEQALGLGRQAVDARGQDGLHGHRHLNTLQRLRQAIGARLTSQRAGLNERAHALFQEKGIAGRTRDQHRRERRQAGVVAQERLEDFGGTRRGQRVEAQVRGVRLAAPAMLILGAVVDQQQEPGRGQALHQAVELGLGLGIDPV